MVRDKRNPRARTFFAITTKVTTSQVSPPLQTTGQSSLARSPIIMPAKGSRVVKGTWDNPGFLNDLALALYEAANQAGALDPAAREGIEEFIKQQGHGTSWEGIRFGVAASLLRVAPATSLPPGRQQGGWVGGLE
ncbi:box C/D snoRNA protein [Purpureocillium lavendulum]|uniref:Box C/D snoRNA protein n=1 Tax=Purpureocillium lavendulum TaxID=1247861 RepID=A0AB34FRE0_9HYPO|nr:box C/D snoRNA protein [Purpureocillium lavendulum]